MQVAILGCGQLARMMALAGMPMGMHFSFLAESNEDIAAVAGLGKIVTMQDGDRAEDLYEALGRPQVITVEREQFDVNKVRQFVGYCAVHPVPEAIYQCQNRWRQKQLLVATGVSHTPCQPLRGGSDLEDALARFGDPLVIKHTEQGYDGKAQWRLKTDDDKAAFLGQAHWGDGADDTVFYLAEPTMAFEREVSFIAVRSLDGEIRFYPATENVHEHGVLLRSVAPAMELPEHIVEEAQAGLARVLAHLGYVGVMAMECFIAGDQWWVNELAPRVHNSGHWTQLAGVASQFENHLRAVAGWPLGSTQLHGAAGMLNLLGVPLDQKEMLAQGVGLHWYNKSVRPGRKVGHLVLQEADAASARDRLLVLQQRIYGQD